MPENNEFVDQPELRNLGKRIRSERESRGIGPDELARKIGIGEGEIVAIESGLKDFTFLLFLSLSRALEIPPMDLLGGNLTP